MSGCAENRGSSLEFSPSQGAGEAMTLAVLPSLHDHAGMYSQQAVFIHAMDGVHPLRIVSFRPLTPRENRDKRFLDSCQRRRRMYFDLVERVLGKKNVVVVPLPPPNQCSYYCCYCLIPSPSPSVTEPQSASYGPAITIIGRFRASLLL